MRAVFRPFVIHAAYSPIETIVFFCILGTLAYFHILSAIKHSAFFAPSLPQLLRPTYALFHDEEWVPVREHAWFHAKSGADASVTPLEFQQLIFSLDSAHKQKDVIPESINLNLSPLAESTANVSTFFAHAFQSASGRKYSSVCHSLSDSACLTQTTLSPRTLTQTLTFAPGSRDEFIASVLRHKFATDEAGVRFEVEARQVENIGQMKSGKWVAYAARAFVLRFWDLAKKADSLDILLILLGYILMHTTFILLLSRSRRLGSNFWLPCAIMSSAILALLISLPLAMIFRIPLDPVALTEALPFLVCTVGFDKPLRLARAVFSHPHLTTPVGGVSAGGQLKPAGKIITECLEKVYFPIIRDYSLEIIVLVVGANSKVGGLREVCALAALLLSVDCLLLCTYLSSILCVMIEVRRIQNGRALTRSRSPSITAASAPIPSISLSPPTVKAKHEKETTVSRLTRKISSSVLGVKGSSLPAHGKRPETPENPVARLKLLLIASFLILHILNLCTPLAPSKHNGSNTSSTSHSMLNTRKVDITAPGVRSALDSLAVAFVSVPYAFTTEPLVKISPPIHIRVLPPPALLRSSQTATSVVLASPSAGPQTTSEMVESFMSTWTRLVGDPILSKWIVVLLAISISLNGYLLKGIAAGLAGRGVERGKGHGGVRFEGGEKGDAEAEVEVLAEVVARKNVPVMQAERKTAGVVPTFTLEDVDRRLKARRLTISSSVPPPSAVTTGVSVPASVTTSTTVTTTASSSSTTSSVPSSPDSNSMEIEQIRSLDECLDIFDNGPRPLSLSLSLLSDEELIMLAQNGKIAAYALEKVLGSSELERAVRIRRALISRASTTQTLEHSDVPMTNYDYSRVLGACCENVVGYIPLPLGIAGPLKVDGALLPIPMATAEGTLVASTSRGCKALNAGGGVTTVLTQDAMTRGPAIDFPSIVEAAQAKAWIASEEGYGILKEAFESTSRFAKLRSMKTAMAGRTLFVRFATATGDAMGMNMISKGTEKALEVMQKQFPDMIVLALSGNYCTDKKPAAINWIEGRGKSVVAEAVIPGRVVKSVLKTTVEALCNLNVKKNLVGSAMAGSIGGFNAHAANILTAVFLATGQDPAQNVESSNCMTLMEPTNNGEDLLMTVSMPSIEVGTVGGGTVLAPQQAVLEMLGLKGAHATQPGTNAQGLARLIAAAVMAGELSLLSALAAGHLVRAHLVHNRSQTNTPAASLPATPGPDVPPSGGFLASVRGMVKKELTPSSSTASLPPYTK